MKPLAPMLEALKNASVRVEGPKPGTGYLVAESRVATCHHVVDLWNEEAWHDVVIGDPHDVARRAKVVARDPKTDCAVLQLDEPVELRPLPLATTPLEVEALWNGYGFPHSMNVPGGGIKPGGRITGEVLDPDNRDETGRVVIHLFSKQAAAGAAAPLHGFSGTPVLVDGAVVGHVIRHVGDPDDSRRPAYGLIFASPIAGILSLLDVAPVGRQIRPARLADPTSFVEDLERHGVGQASDTGVPEEATVRSARVLIATNRPELALKLLGAANADSLKAKQVTALAEGKTGNHQKAITILKQLIREGANDEETWGMLGGRYKAEWRASRSEAALRASHATYREAFERTADSYNGINAAATALYLGDAVTSAALARQVEQHLPRTEDMGHWELATLGEVLLLQNKLDEARPWYEAAVAKEPGRIQDIAVMRTQARLNLKHLGYPRHTLDRSLPVPGIVVYAGHMIDEDGRTPPRFPRGQVGAVRRAIRARLETLGQIQGFGTAAKGSDIIFLEEMVKRQIQPIAVMPFPEEVFRSMSVGPKWGERFDAIRDRVEIVVIDSEVPAPGEVSAVFERSNRVVQRLALAHARRLEEKPRLLVVWDGQPGDGPGGTASMVEWWRDEGYREPIVIDPRSPQGA